jgi:alpha-galactosidase
MAGNDLRSMTTETRDILANREVIGVNQDPAGRQGRKVRDDGAAEVWVRELADGGRAVVLFNRDTTATAITVRWTEMGYPARLEAAVRDLWAHRDLGRVRGEYQATVPAHAAVMVRITP